MKADDGEALKIDAEDVPPTDLGDVSNDVGEVPNDVGEVPKDVGDVPKSNDCDCKLDELLFSSIMLHKKLLKLILRNMTISTFFIMDIPVHYRLKFMGTLFKSYKKCLQLVNIFYKRTVEWYRNKVLPMR